MVTERRNEDSGERSAFSSRLQRFMRFCNANSQYIAIAVATVAAAAAGIAIAPYVADADGMGDRACRLAVYSSLEISVFFSVYSVVRLSLKAFSQSLRSDGDEIANEGVNSLGANRTHRGHDACIRLSEESLSIRIPSRGHRMFCLHEADNDSGVEEEYVHVSRSDVRRNSESESIVSGNNATQEIDVGLSSRGFDVIEMPRNSAIAHGSPKDFSEGCNEKTAVVKSASIDMMRENVIADRQILGNDVQAYDRTETPSATLSILQTSVTPMCEKCIKRAS